MPSLHQLVAAHQTLLLLDAASSRIQVGLLRSNGNSWAEMHGDAIEAVFSTTRLVLERAHLGISDVRGFAYCEGPGSMLGVRTTVVALRTWLLLASRPAYAYDSLMLLGSAEAERRGKGPFSVVSDARRDTWHLRKIDDSGQVGPLLRVPAAELPLGEWVEPEGFGAWSYRPRPATIVSYSVESLLASAGERDLFRPVNTPEPLALPAPEYRRWIGRPHSSASISHR